MRYVVNGAIVVKACLAAQAGDIIEVEDYDTQEYAWRMLDALGKNWVAGEPDAVLVHARVAGDDTMDVTEYVIAMEEQR